MISKILSWEKKNPNIRKISIQKLSWYKSWSITDFTDSGSWESVSKSLAVPLKSWKETSQKIEIKKVLLVWMINDFKVFSLSQLSQLRPCYLSCLQTIESSHSLVSVLPSNSLSPRMKCWRLLQLPVLSGRNNFLSGLYNIYPKIKCLSSYQ